MTRPRIIKTEQLLYLMILHQGNQSIILFSYFTSDYKQNRVINVGNIFKFYMKILTNGRKLLTYDDLHNQLNLKR
jgi:hypothetical protein